MEWVPNGDLMTYLEERRRLCKFCEYPEEKLNTHTVTIYLS